MQSHTTKQELQFRGRHLTYNILTLIIQKKTNVFEKIYFA